MVTQLHAATLMTYQAAARLDARRAITREAAMVKLFASEMAVTVTDEAVRIFASYGLANEYPVQRYFRDARFLLPAAAPPRSCASSSVAISTGTAARRSTDGGTRVQRNQTGGERRCMHGGATGR